MKRVVLSEEEGPSMSAVISRTGDQPFSVTASAVRALLEGSATHQWIWQSLAWSAGILAVFFVIAVRLYHNITR